jgi:hypothetical protein
MESFMTGLLERVPVDRVIVAIDPGKVLNRVWITSGEGLLGEPVSLPTSRVGVDRLEGLVAGGGLPVFALEATGSLHRAWAAELERRWPGSLRLFAPSQTQAARTQLGTRRFKTDDRDCAALVWLARQGAGQPARSSAVDALRSAAAHRRQLVLALKPLRQRLHDQLNALAPGLSAPSGHGRALALETSTGRAVLACAVAFAGRAPSARSLRARPPRLPALLANASQPTALRRSALRSRQARPRAVTAIPLCRTTAQSSLPPARARRSSRRTRKPAARRRLISLPT